MLALGVMALFLYGWAMATPTVRLVPHGTFAGLTAAYHYQATVVSDALYPQGGIAPTNGTIFPSITTGLAVTFQPTGYATAPTVVSLQTSPILRVIARGLWQQDFGLGAPQRVTGRLSALHVLPTTWQVNVSQVMAQISNIQKAIQAVPNTYLVVIDPRMHGVIREGNTVKPLSWDPRLVFKLQSGTWQVQGHLAQVHPLHFNRATKLPVFLYFLGAHLRPSAARTQFGISALALLVGGILLRLLGRTKREPLSEWQRMEQKYRGRIVRTSLEVGALQRELLRVESFQALARLGEERELPILRAESRGAVEYLVVDGDLAYVMRYSQTAEDEPVPQAVSGLTHGA